MGSRIPRVLSDAITAGTWHDPGPDFLRTLFGKDLDLVDLELFEDVAMMRRVAGQLDYYGYVDERQFCMVRDVSSLEGPGDSRLAFQSALFVGGSKISGDDVFIALDLRGNHDDPNVLVLDWRKPIPDRWVVTGLLSEFIAGLSAGNSE